MDLGVLIDRRIEQHIFVVWEVISGGSWKTPQHVQR